MLELRLITHYFISELALSGNGGTALSTTIIRYGINVI